MTLQYVHYLSNTFKAPGFTSTRIYQHFVFITKIRAICTQGWLYNANSRVTILLLPKIPGLVQDFKDSMTNFPGAFRSPRMLNIIKKASM